jgi:hypothetical protein
MRTITNPTSRRIGQLIRMLSSDQPGEVTAAGQALVKTLSAAGLDIHELARVAETELRLPPTPEGPRRRPAAAAKARRPDGRPLAMDEQLICDAPDGVFRPCQCGGILFTIAPGAGPHAAQLVCDACSRGGRWLGRGPFFGARP